MYSDWVSLSENIRNDDSGRSALEYYPTSVGLDVARAVVKNLVDDPVENTPKRVMSVEDVKWTMNVICFGLGMPLSEGDTVKGCVHTYLDWLGCLSSQPKETIPNVILNDPNMYCERILQHFKNLFKPRSSSSLALQASLCMKVLQGVQRISHECTKINEKTINTMLRFLLSISDSLLSPPFVPGGLTEQLCKLLIEVLFDVWLQACVWAFPDPSLWRTLQEMCSTWRHHGDLVMLWNKTMFSITRRLMLVEYGSKFPLYPLHDRKHEIRIPISLDRQCLMQCWFRFLHIVDNPVDLAKREVIGNMPKFKEHALVSGQSLQLSEHPCLMSMPQNFYTAMKGIATLADTLLGKKCTCDSPIMYNEIIHDASNCLVLKNGIKEPLHNSSSNDQILNMKRSFDSKSQGQVEVPIGFLLDQPDGRNTNLLMPYENTVLHLLGSWLFEATLTHVNVQAVKTKLHLIWQMYHRSSEACKKDADVSVNENNEFEQGRAEAFGALCRIYCSQRSGMILPIYLSRFYFSLAAGLIYDESCSGHVLSSILLNSTDLLRVNLPGVDVILPHLLAALEKVLGHNELSLKCNVKMVQLQRAAIHLLLSMLCLPDHFADVSIANLSTSEKVLDDQTVSFLSLKPTLRKLLINALETETDSHNTQLLLGGVMLFVQDSALVEEQCNTCTSHSPGSHRQPKEPYIQEEEMVHDKDDVNQPEHSEKKDCGAENNNLGSSTSALFGYLNNLVNKKLIFGSKWKTDIHVTLSAFELMSAMAETRIHNINKEECRRTIKWLCDYVEYQAKQPAPFHTRDLHSMMVAAFNCLLTWISSHPWLLDGQKSLQAILEVVELGISGTKSKANENHEQLVEDVKILPKGEKILRPASFRVREAAEGLLSCIMDNVGAFPSPCGPASCSALMDEDILMEFLPEDDQNKHFQYFVVEDSVIMGILQESVQTHDGIRPTATILLRGPTGRTSWTVELRQIPDCKKDTLGVCQHDAPKRPEPNLDIPVIPPCVRPHFPADVECVTLTKANLSIPCIDQIPCEKLSLENEFFQNLIDQQKEEELTSQEMVLNEKESSSGSLVETKPPKSVCEFSACRMILARLGLLRPDNYEKVRSMDTPSSLTSISRLDTVDNTLRDSLRELDRLPTRCFDTVYILYMKSDQDDAKLILRNEIKYCEYKDMFCEFLRSLGWPVDIEDHPGWTGNMNTSWNLNNLKTYTSSHHNNSHTLPRKMSSLDSNCNEPLTAVLEESEDSKDDMAADYHKIMYYADIRTEIAFIVPSLFPRVEAKRRKSRPITPKTKRKVYAEKRTSSVSSLPSVSSSSSLLDVLPPNRTLTLTRNTADTGIDLRYLSKLNTHSTLSEINILVVWLEKFLDHDLFPEADILNELGISSKEPTAVTSPSGKPVERETAVIFIAPLHNGLFRIRTKCTMKSPMAGPLVDGMVVSQRSLGAMVRHTAVNIGCRRRLDIDNYSSPHVYRKLKIQDIIRRCRQEMTFPEFYASLFRG